LAQPSFSLLSVTALRRRRFVAAGVAQKTSNPPSRPIPQPKKLDASAD
jgi:hypothetical protein